MLTINQIELLHILLMHDFAGLKLIKQRLQYSHRKLQMEMRDINECFSKNKLPFQIKNDRKRGYYLENKEQADSLGISVNNILEHTVMRHLSHYPRVAEILRELLIATDFVKAHDLAETFFISSATLSLDLRLVREILSMYGLVLESVPYYGLKISGPLMVQFSCLNDLIEWNREEKIFENISFGQLGINKKEYERCEQELLTKLCLYQVELSTLGIRKVVSASYLLNLPKFENLKLKALPEIEKLNEYQIALFLSLNKHTQHVLAFTYIILANLELGSTFNEKSHGYLYEKVTNDFEVLRSQLLHDANFDINTDEQFVTKFKVFLLRFQIQKEFGIRSYTTITTLVDIIKSKPATNALTAKILTLLGQKQEHLLNDSMYYELGILIYNIAYSNSSNYETIRMGVVSDFGAISTESIIKHLNLDRFDIEYYPISSSQLTNLDASMYDCILSTSTLYPAPDLSIPIVNHEYLFKQADIMSFWNKVLVNKRKANYITEQLSQRKVVNLKMNSKDLIQEICTEIEQHHIDIKDLSIQLKLMLSHQKSWFKRDQINLAILTKTTVQPNVFEFVLHEKMEISFDEYKFIRVVLFNPYQKFLSIKQADSSIKRI